MVSRGARLVHPQHTLCSAWHWHNIRLLWPIRWVPVRCSGSILTQTHQQVLANRAPNPWACRWQQSDYLSLVLLLLLPACAAAAAP